MQRPQRESCLILLFPKQSHPSFLWAIGNHPGMTLQEERISFRLEKKREDRATQKPKEIHNWAQAEQAGATLPLPLFEGSRDLPGSGSPPPPEPPRGSAVPPQPCRSLRRGAQHCCTPLIRRGSSPKRQCCSSGAAPWTVPLPAPVTRARRPEKRSILRGSWTSNRCWRRRSKGLAQGGRRGKARPSLRRCWFSPSLKPSPFPGVVFAVPSEDSPPVPVTDLSVAPKPGFWCPFGVPGVNRTRATVPLSEGEVPGSLRRHVFLLWTVEESDSCICGVASYDKIGAMQGFSYFMLSAHNNGVDSVIDLPY